MRKAAEIICRNREPVTSTCRMPPALTLQRKNPKPDGKATLEVQHAKGKELTQPNTFTTSRYRKRHVPLLYPSGQYTLCTKYQEDDTHMKEKRGQLLS